MTEQEREQAGLSRRSLIKRSAIVGGAAVWATPVVQSFTNAAGAAVPAAGSEACEACFVAVTSAPGQPVAGTKAQFLTDEAQEAYCSCFLGSAQTSADQFICFGQTLTAFPGEVAFVACGDLPLTPCSCP